ncbi:MAG: hypothetical protein M1828_004551 [Chrysothrix sp. TS-e1954]|nr:MAG: hypothetical protein M1828_004551 [Chrysothrix sp. TS-e1954]
MNYVSAVYAVMMLIIGTDWLLRGRRHYNGASARQELVEEIVQGKGGGENPRSSSRESPVSGFERLVVGRAGNPTILQVEDVSSKADLVRSVS